MSAEYVRSTYVVPARRGGKVLTHEGPGVIRSFDSMLRVSLSREARRTFRMHPTWCMRYLDATGAVIAGTACDTADERAARNAEDARILRETLAAECSTRGHSAADWCGCSRCGAALSTAEWQALVAAEVGP